MKCKILAKLIALLWMTAYSYTVSAAIHPLQDIQESAIQFAEMQFANITSENIQISAKQLDSRLRLPLCKTSLQAYLPHNANTYNITSIGVRCNSNKPWSIYVPIVIKIYREIAISNQSVPRGKILTSADFHMERIEINRISGAYVTNPEEIIGKQLSRSIQAGRPVLSTMVAKPLVTRRGDSVTILAKSRTYEVRVVGKALMDGAIGDRIKVKNLRSKKIVEGIIAASGMILVN